MSGRRTALIVATDAYRDVRLRRLRAPVHDAEALAGVLADPEIGGFEVDVLINEEEAQVRRRLAGFFQDQTREDLAVLHVSCHGVKDEDGVLYFATTDTELEHLDATALAADFVNRQMTRSPSRRIALLLDCCYSGAFARGMMPRSGDGLDLRERFDGHGRVVLTASSATEYAFEGDGLSGEGTPSVFTTALVDGLRTGEADLDCDGAVSVDELYEFVHERVRLATPNQTPSKWTLGMQGDLVIARSRRRVDAVSLIPEEVRMAVESPFTSTRAAAVDELVRLTGSANGTLRSGARELLTRLTADDSRRVSAAAAAALAGAGTPPAAEATPVTAPAVEPVPDATSGGEATIAAGTATAAPPPAMSQSVGEPTTGGARRTAPRLPASDRPTPRSRILAWADRGHEHVAWAASAALVALSALGLVLVQRIYEAEGHGGSGKLWEHSDSGSERPFWTMIVLLVLVAATAALVASGRLQARRSLPGAVGAAVLLAVATVDATVVDAIWTSDGIGLRRSYVVALALVAAAGILTWHAGGAMPVGRAPLRRPVALLPGVVGIAAAAVLFEGGRPATVWVDTAAGLLVVLGVAASFVAAVRGDDRARTTACVLAAAAVLVLLTFSALGSAWAIAHAGLSLTLVMLWLLVEVAALLHVPRRFVTTTGP